MEREGAYKGFTINSTFKGACFLDSVLSDFLIILKVWPLAGPVAGGTEVEIHGHDLGKEFADVNNSVVVAGYKCRPSPKKYQPSKM